jgi:hypothetical protein
MVPDAAGKAGVGPVEILFRPTPGNCSLVTLKTE